MYDKAYNEEHGTDYGIQIISTDVVDSLNLGYNGYDDDTFTKSLNLYNTIISTLNTEAKNYLNKIYVSDARCVGSNPAKPDWDEVGYFTSTENYMTNYNGILKDSDKNYETDYNQMEILSIIGSSSDYWLASRANGFNNNSITKYTFLKVRNIISRSSGTSRLSAHNMITFSSSGGVSCRYSGYGIRFTSSIYFKFWS